MADGKEVEETFSYFDRITTVRGDSTGIGDFPMEYMQDHSGLPMGDESLVKFTAQSKNEMYTTLEAALFREAGDPQRLSYPADHPLAAELEEQMTTARPRVQDGRRTALPARAGGAGGARRRLLDAGPRLARGGRRWDRVDPCGLS